ncbi:uncharacterized protein LOC133314828 [Gastrolobium bilobum]|uniref:uncharacterized protein LOC133314828 n=1 Tax=Gastrolobium bilobum TaxID=150636 RepID=UPI002AB10C51|nr:uncharacterized protein LOC133314828 [Gastrolobium bilobum]
MQSLSILPIPHTFHHYDDEQGEFSFACTNPQGTLIFADEIFHNGQIRPFFPAFLHNSDAVSPLPPSLKKLFIEKRNSFPSKLKDGKTSLSTTLEVVELVAASNNERCKKSNSTGFSKQLRFRRELNPRSNSTDSKNVFVFLNPPAPEPLRFDVDEANNNDKKKGRGKIGGKTVSSSSSHEKHYLKNRMRNESIKRRSFLPYRVGFLANMNAFNRKIHPF